MDSVLSDDELRKLPSGALDFLRSMLDPLFNVPTEYNIFTGNPLPDPDHDFWHDYCRNRELESG